MGASPPGFSTPVARAGLFPGTGMDRNTVSMGLARRQEPQTGPLLEPHQTCREGATAAGRVIGPCREASPLPSCLMHQAPTQGSPVHMVLRRWAAQPRSLGQIALDGELATLFLSGGKRGLAGRGCHGRTGGSPAAQQVKQALLRAGHP